MNYSLLRESKVIVVKNGRAFEFDALADISATLDYEEYKTTRKTLHKKRSYPISKVVAKNVTDVSLAVNLTDNFLESYFFTWLGMQNFNGLLSLPFFVEKMEPEYFDIYIVSTSNIFYLQHCFISAIDFTIEKSIPLLNLAMQASDCTLVRDYPVVGSIMQGNVLGYSPLRVNINNNEMPSVIGAGISLQQQCTWREDRTIHDINTINTTKRAYITEMNASATINFYLVNRFNTTNIIDEEPMFNVPVTIFNKYINVTFPCARITKRLTVADVYTVAYDILPTEQGDDPVTIKFYGE